MTGLVEIVTAGGTLTALVAVLYRLRRRRPAEPQPEDPLQPVGAKLKPRRPDRSSAVALEEPDEDEQ